LPGRCFAVRHMLHELKLDGDMVGNTAVFLGAYKSAIAEEGDHFAGRLAPQRAFALGRLIGWNMLAGPDEEPGIFDRQVLARVTAAVSKYLPLIIAPAVIPPG
ncbi:hypothetical protein LCGC14_3108580, partial [marine sediment metagenome]